MSTNMLTWVELEALCRREVLIRRILKRGQPVDGRSLYLFKDVCDELESSPWPCSDGETASKTAQRRAAMRQVLERYTLGHQLVINNDIKELGSDHARVKMRGYWAIRSQGPRTQTRIFGFFARPGAFVATAFRSRDVLPEAEDWEKERAACIKRWESISNGKEFMSSPWPVKLRSQLNVYLDSEND